MNTGLVRAGLLLLSTLLAGLCVAQWALAQTTRPPINQEYLVRQGAEESLLITINAYEAEFASRISGQAGELLLHSNIIGSRIAPVFQYVPSSGNERQLNIAVTSGQYSAQSEFGLELTRLTAWDDRSSAISRAYSLLSFGMQAGEEAGGTNWTVKIDSLINAARIFQQFGMKEMRLWANFLAAHLVELHLNDHSIAYSMTREILRDLQGSKLPRIELAVMQLQNVTLIGLKRAGALPTNAENPNPVQAALSRTAALAESLGFQFEQASALNASAIEYAAEANYAAALQQFQEAVTIADAVGETDFATGIRERIVEIHTSQGNSPASGEVLREIEAQLLEDGGGDELALNLLAQGRLLSRSYRYRDAINVLGEALLHENNSAIRKQVNFALARAFYESGRFDEALAYFRLAGVAVGDQREKRANTIIDMGNGFGMLAGIYRVMGDHEKMREARSAQGSYATESSHHLYERGLDQLAVSGNSSQLARSLFTQSHAAALRSGHLDIQHLSRLRACVQGTATDGLCRRSAVKTSYDWLLRGGIPKFSIEAMWLWAQLLDSDGQRSSAVSVADMLLNELHFLRHSLPGVLGSWYRENSPALFEYCLDLQLRTNQGVKADATTSLLTLTRVRHIDGYSDFMLSPDIKLEDTEALRIQLAQRARFSIGTFPQGLVTEINRQLEERRQPFRQQFAYLSQAGIQIFLRSLSNEERFVTYHISSTAAQVWVGAKGRVQRRVIKNPADTLAAMHEVRRELASTAGPAITRKLDDLGKRLLDPVKDLLAKTIYLAPAGPLLGFPFDALRTNGYHAIERHTIINLASFPANSRLAARLKAGELNNVFVAGHPQEYTGGFATRLDTSPEISAVADIFIGPGLRIIQGVALLPDEFQEEAFQQADLLHLSMPGVIDLRHPEQSSLQLSGDEYFPRGVLMLPADVQSQELSASLVFLSATRMEKHPLTGFGAQTGLVSAILEAGASAVIANSLGADGETGYGVVTDFYRRLESSGNIAAALRDAKLQALKNNPDTGLYDWAGYQLFIN